MTNLEKLQKIANFRVDKIYDVKFDNGDRKHYEYETIRDLCPNWFAEIEYSLAYYERQQEYKAKWLVAFEIIKKKKVNVRFLISCKTLKEYNDVISDHLTPQEYDLLKEALK